MVEVFIAAAVTAIVEVVKRYVGAKTWETVLVLIVVSLLGGVAMVWLKEAELWDSFYQIVLYASGIYALFVRATPQIVKGE